MKKSENAQDYPQEKHETKAGFHNIEIPENYAALMYQRGIFKKVLGIGTHKIPSFFGLLSSLQVVFTGERKIEINATPTDPNFVKIPNLRATLNYKIVDPKLAMLEVKSHEKHARMGGKLALESYCTRHSLEEIRQDYEDQTNIYENFPEREYFSRAGLELRRITLGPKEGDLLLTHTIDGESLRLEILNEETRKNER